MPASFTHLALSLFCQKLPPPSLPGEYVCIVSSRLEGSLWGQLYLVLTPLASRHLVWCRVLLILAPGAIALSSPPHQLCPAASQGGKGQAHVLQIGATGAMPSGGKMRASWGEGSEWG